MLAPKMETTPPYSSSNIKISPAHRRQKPEDIISLTAASWLKLADSGEGLAATSGLYYFELENLYAFRTLYGDDITQRLLSLMEDELKPIAGESLRSCKRKRILQMESGQFIILCGPQGCDIEEMSDKALTMRLKLKERLKKDSIQLTGQSMNILAGYSLVSNYGSLGPEAGLYNSLCDAQRTARNSMDNTRPTVLNEFRTILNKRQLSSVFQPIVDLTTGDIYGWEALTRGPSGSLFRSPSTLFDYAEDIGEIFFLEKTCRETAIRSIGEIQNGQKMFLNIHPRTLVDPDFSPGETLKLLKANGLSPDKVVFEITERHAVRDFTMFHTTLEHYRGQGYMVAVDDVGTGHSGLQSIAEIRPDFLKLDMSLIRDVDTNPIKRALLETFVTLSEKIGSKIIAEGIETATELSSIISMGTHYGQGYYLAKPEHPKPGPVLNLPNWSIRSGKNVAQVKCSIPIKDLADSAYPVEPDTSVSEVKNILKGDEPISSVVVAENGRPVGLIMSHHLDRCLSSQYGMSLYYHREVTRIMDSAPLTVEQDTPVESTAQRAMSRDRSKIYDHIIITDKGILTGIVSVQNMLDTLASVQVEMAKGANPLSGLPGNVALEQEIEKRSSLGEPFSIIYADLDHFKVYNDVYGFKSGDDIILLLSKILKWAAGRHGDADTYLGHVGGDDFVIITATDTAERMCVGITRTFGRLVKYHYTHEDRRRGYFTGKDREGVERVFPLISVSLAVVDIWERTNSASISRRSAEMKKYAKSVQGNCWVRDRRDPVPAE